MRIVILTYGSRGDVQPYIEIAHGLLEKGYSVAIATTKYFGSFIEGQGLEFIPLYGDPVDTLHSEEFGKLVQRANNWEIGKYLFKERKKDWLKIQYSILDACIGVEFVLIDKILANLAVIIAEHLGCSYAISVLTPPSVPTKEHPSPLFRKIDHPWFNFASHIIVNNLLALNYKYHNRKFKSTLKTLVIKQPHNPDIKIKNAIFHCVSPQLIPRPNDWPAHCFITGSITSLKAKEQISNTTSLPTDLLTWINSGPPPVFISFGSIPIADPVFLKDLIDIILFSAHERIIFCKGWTKDLQVSNHRDLYTIDGVDHQKLFPLCKAAIIHGGIGTLTRTLEAGIPTIIVSIFGDQPLWGEIISRSNLGVHLPYGELDAGKLITALAKINEPVIIENIKKINKQILLEDGVKVIADAIDSFFKS